MEKVYETERLLLKVIDSSYAWQVLDYYIRNKEFLEEWEPVKDDKFYTLEAQAEQLEKDTKNMEEGRLLRLWVFEKSSGRLVGSVVFNNIVRGAFLSCHLGYKSDNGTKNKGYMTEAIRKGIEIMFDEYKLHRIEANIMPKNKASMRVVEKLGFYNEGLAYKYLRINGVWEDHIHMVLLNDKL